MKRRSWWKRLLVKLKLWASDDLTVRPKPEIADDTAWPKFKG